MTDGGCAGSVAGTAAGIAGVQRAQPRAACSVRAADQPFSRQFALSPAVLFGLGAFAAAGLLLPFDYRYAALPLLAFVVACSVAPFVTAVGFFLPIVSRGRRGEHGVALTFDDGPDPQITPRLLDLLDRHGVGATFFVTGEKAARHPDILREIVLRGHSVGNHSYSHMPLLMLKGMRTLEREVRAAQSVLGLFGIVPLAFRPPVGITNPHLRRVLLDQGMYCVNFSCRTADFGNRRIAGLASRVLGKVSHGDIVALHDVVPPRADAVPLLGEFESLIVGLRERRLDIVPLARLIGREVMRREATPGSRLPNDARFLRTRLPAGIMKDHLGVGGREA
jgi:peptidoglycan/xylan/chitin deacetylase (PgdA/CDA1 family)